MGITDNDVLKPSDSRCRKRRLPHKELHMATKPAMDPTLLDRAVQVSGERTKKAAVTKALQEFITG